MVSWSWYPVGGDWTYVDNMKKLYQENNIEVIPFSTKHENNLEGNKFFIKGYDYKELNKNKSISKGLKALKNSIVSFEALGNVDKLLDEHKIDFAHLHIIHHWITPAIIWKLRKRGIPIIWTLHEYKLICPEGSFVSNEKVCEKCFGANFQKCAINRCKKQSFLASSLATLDAFFYKTTNVYNHVDAYLCPSEFLLKKFKQFNFHIDKLRLTNYCYDISLIDKHIESYEGKTQDLDKPERFILFVGRVEKLKGIKTLISAVENTAINLRIAGTGAALEEMQEYVRHKGLQNVVFLGFQKKEKVFDLTIQSVCVVCPSEWYENYPFSVIESLLLSKPVIGSRIGGIPELVVDGETGFLHDPGDVVGLREKMLQLWNDEELVKKLGNKARTYAYGKVNFDSHWKIMNNVIQTLPLKVRNTEVTYSEYKYS